MVSSRAAGGASRANRGFTLLELLIVMVIAGVLLATVSVNAVPDPRQALERDARRIGLLIGVAGDEARIRSERVYWEADLRGYRFYTLRDGERQLLTDDLLRERPWDRPLTQLAVYEGASEQPTQWILAAGAPPVRLPVARESIGPAWRLDLANDSGRVSVRIDAAGRGQVVAPQ
jgi:general secretion pathway protein H